MALNPLRDALSQAGLRAYRHESAFKTETNAALDAFKSLRNDLERKVHRGDLTPKSAREQATAAAAQIRETLLKKAESFSAVPRVFVDKLVETSNARRRAKDNLSLEGLQRETNHLLRLGQIEQQMITRAAEFEGRSFTRPVAGGHPVPTLKGLLDFHESASLAGDDAALEWGRRQLESYRNLVIDPDDQRRIDLATDRPDRVNPRLVASYVQAMQGQDDEGKETFATQALESRDANACMAAYLLARDSSEGAESRWVRIVLSGVGQFPESAVNTLRTWEADSRYADVVAARAQAEYAVALAEAEARFPGLEGPTQAELRRMEFFEGKPAAKLGEPIGLALDRRGMTSEEYEASRIAPPE